MPQGAVLCAFAGMAFHDKAKNEASNKPNKVKLENNLLIGLSPNPDYDNNRPKLALNLTCFEH